MQAPEAEFRHRAAAGVSSEDVGKADGSSGMRLVELNGSRGGPIDRGECNDLLRVRHPIFALFPLSLCAFLMV